MNQKPCEARCRSVESAAATISRPAIERWRNNAGLLQSCWRTLGLSLFIALGCGRGAESRPVLDPTPASQVGPAPSSIPVEVPADPGGIGSLETRSERGDVGALALEAVDVRASQQGDMAAVSVEHVFHNESSSTLEGTFRFPMPDGALLTGLAMEIGGRFMEGELLEREKARKVYETIVDAMQDPALLEWEQGTTFKLRVFPIEPNSDKRVRIRYLVPLRQSSKGLVFTQGTRGAKSQGLVGHLTVRFEDRIVFDEHRVSRDRIIEVPAAVAPAILREERKDGIYTAVRLSPHWAEVPVPRRAPAQHFLVVVDTSRSSLEEHELALDAMRTVLAALPKDSRFRVFASDLDTRPQPEGFAAPTESAIARAAEFIERIPPDGATDVGGMLRRVAAEAKGVKAPAVVYIGDCEPSWGELDSGRLVTVAERELGRVPFHPLVLGASGDGELALRLADATAGHFERAHRRESLAVFAHQLIYPLPRLSDIQVTAPAGLTVLPSKRLSAEPGSELVLFVKSTAEAHFEELSVRAKVGTKTLDLMPKEPAIPTRSIAQRFGAALIRELERDGKPKAEIVQASLAYGVMSKHTSFLVLESEKAYAEHAIARRSAQAAEEAPRVTGADLESLDGDSADISLSRLQPGDPEITIHAPRDASVTVAFPFGDIKRAIWDPEAAAGRGAFVVRFLVDRDTPEGTYTAIAHIYHRDGRHEITPVKYTVDATAPALLAHLRDIPGRPDRVELVVSQDAPEPERDLRRVEVLLPSGQLLRPKARTWARFTLAIRRSELPSGSRIRVVGSDQALNQSSIELMVP